MHQRIATTKPSLSMSNNAPSWTTITQARELLTAQADRRLIFPPSVKWLARALMHICRIVVLSKQANASLRGT